MASILIFEDVISSFNTPILILNIHLEIVAFNEIFASTFKIHNKISKGILIYELNNNQWDIPELKELLEEILPKKNVIQNYKMTHKFENLGLKTLILYGKKIRIDTDKPEYIFLHIVEFNDYKKNQKTITNTNEIDYMDKQILSELFKDGKISLQQLSERIFKFNGKAMSNTGIKNRIEKLIDNEILHIQGNINIEELNYQVCFHLIEFKHYDHITKFNNLISNCPRVFLLASTTGRFQLILGLVGRNLNDINDCINNCQLMSKNDIDLKNSEMLFASKLEIPKHIPLNIFRTLDDKCECKILAYDSEAFFKRDSS